MVILFFVSLFPYFFYNENLPCENYKRVKLPIFGFKLYFCQSGKVHQNCIFLNSTCIPTILNDKIQNYLIHP